MKILLPILLATALLPSFCLALDPPPNTEAPPTPASPAPSAKGDGLEVRRHNLNYFITGEPDTKIQLSFNAKLFRRFSLYGGYTQTMFWDLYKKSSSPFTDINFNPEVFYRFKLDSGMFKGLDLGVEHKSNGRSGADSRSWNRTYAALRTEFNVGWLKLSWDNKVFYIFDIDEPNRDIRHRMGFLETTVRIRDVWASQLREGEVYLTLYPGGTWNVENIQGSRELGFKFRLPILSFDPFLYFQLYNGMNESQLFYKENRTAWRIGFAI